MIALLESAPVMSDEEYEEWMATREWINKSVAARGEMWDDFD